MTTLLLVFALLATPSHEQARYIMGTVAVVRAEADDTTRAEAAVDAAFAEFTRLEGIFSTWREDSELSRLNRSRPGEWIPLSTELGELLDRSLELAEASGGAFDPTVLPLVRAWGLRGGDAAVPVASTLDSVRGHVGYHLVEIEDGRARFARAGVEIDLGAIAKGYALDRARDVMVAAGATGGVLDLGGILLVFGPQAADSVAVVAPDDPSREVARVEVRDASVATSGQYERFVMIDGQRYGHILDPRSGRPVSRRGSVTVVASSAWLADALATAVFVLGVDEGRQLVNGYPGVRCVFVREGDGGGWSVGVWD